MVNFFHSLAHDRRRILYRIVLNFCYIVYSLGLLEARNECLRLSRENRTRERQIQDLEQQIIANEQDNQRILEQKIRISLEDNKNLQLKLQDVEENAAKVQEKAETEVKEAKSELEAAIERMKRNEMSTSET